MVSRNSEPHPLLARRHLLYLLVLIVGLAIGWRLVGGAVRCYPHYRLDGIASCLLAALFQEDTEYAAGYASGAFQRLRPGMMKDEVLAILGQPLHKYPVKGAREGWRWSRSPGDRSYRVRVVIFDDGKATEIIHRFYID